MFTLRRAPADDGLHELLEDAGRNAAVAARHLHDLLDDYPERAHLVTELRRCEDRGDRLTHDFIHRLRACPPRRCPFDMADGHGLATALDDVVDLAEEVGDTLGTHHVEAPMDQSVALAGTLVEAADQIVFALQALRAGADPSPHLIEIHRLENEGDRISRGAIAALFASGIDPMVIIRWKDIFESLEEAVDACERVAHVIEGITLRRR